MLLISMFNLGLCFSVNGFVVDYDAVVDRNDSGVGCYIFRQCRIDERSAETLPFPGPLVPAMWHVGRVYVGK
jgi:hypothetical protein